MTTVCNIWMICLELNWFVYDPSRMLHLSEFVLLLRSSMRVVFNNFLLIDARDTSKISSLFIAISLYPLSFFANTPFKKRNSIQSCVVQSQFCENHKGNESMGPWPFLHVFKRNSIQGLVCSLWFVLKFCENRKGNESMGSLAYFSTRGYLNIMEYWRTSWTSFTKTTTKI